MQLVLVVAFGLFVAGSFAGRFPTGQEMGRTFASTLWEMLKLLPCAFILVALFDVWVKRETVERHFGEGSGIRGYMWGIVLAGMTVGGIYVAFPVAYSLFRKGAKLSVIFAYVGFAGVCRIPMTMFEASFMGGLFTAVRLGVSIPLVIIASLVMGRVLERCGYAVSE
ncbi:MAG: permease [Planctomycetes bacterium]|nr:permease [Planctomycetota bacterium]